MRRALLIALLLTTRAAFADEQKTIEGSIEDLWPRAIAAVQQFGTITRSDRSAGIIEGENTSGAKPGWFTCPRGSGILHSEGYALSVLITKASDTHAQVRVFATGMTYWYRNRYNLWSPSGRVFTTVRCTASSGLLEAQLFNVLSGTNK